jgi:hypothetical protein
MDESLPHHAKRQWRRLAKYLVRIHQNHAAKFCEKIQFKQATIMLKIEQALMLENWLKNLLTEMALQPLLN